jgi:hypothetical protein
MNARPECSLLYRYTFGIEDNERPRLGQAMSAGRIGLVCLPVNGRRIPW